MMTPSVYLTNFPLSTFFRVFWLLFCAICRRRSISKVLNTSTHLECIVSAISTGCITRPIFSITLLIVSSLCVRGNFWTFHFLVSVRFMHFRKASSHLRLKGGFLISRTGGGAAVIGSVPNIGIRSSFNRVASLGLVPIKDGLVSSGTFSAFLHPFAEAPTGFVWRWLEPNWALLL